MLVAEHLEHDRRDRVSVAGAVAYLDVQLTYLAQDETFAFDQLAREIGRCTAHVEQVLAVAPYKQRGAPCPVCRTEGRPSRPLVRQYADDTGRAHPDDSRDLWICTTTGCGQRWSVSEYERFVAGEYLEQADRLTAAQIAQRYRIPEGTVRRWAADGRVTRHGYDGQRRQLYDVQEALACRDGDVRTA